MKRFILIAAILLLCIFPASAQHVPTTRYGYAYLGYFEPQVFTAGQTLTTFNQSENDAWCAWAGFPTGGSFVDVYVYYDNTTAGPEPIWGGPPQSWVAGEYPYYDVAGTCAGTSYWAKTFYNANMSGNYTYVSDFEGSPLLGSGPLSVTLTDKSTPSQSATAWNWTITPATGWYLTSGTINSKDIGVAFVTNGNYTINHGTKWAYGSDTETKIDYIWIYNSTATSTTHAVARDLYTGFAINGAQVDMYDVENSSWTNTTTTNGEGSITTPLGHTINIYGSATGYSDDNLIGVPEVDGGYYSLLLTPTNLTTYNTTPGNLTLVVTVQDLQIPHQTLQGAEVTAAWGSQYASGTTNAAGNTFFTVPNNTAIHLSAFKSGYASGSSTHITGAANGGSTMETAIVYIGTDYVTPVPSVTLTTGPGGTIPQTVDPYPCIGDGSAQDTANCQRKQGSMAADLISYGPDLVKFFIMLTFIGGLLLITGKR